MSEQRPLFRLEEVREGERQDVLERREQAGMSCEEVDKDLCGLSLSGGGLRAASFGLGIIQALHKTGVWRFVDYMSTVSGGGYIGAYLSSSVLKDERKFDRDHFPLREGDRHHQPPEVQRLTYGGHYLFRPWLLFNKWLIGLVMINLALFSGIVFVCALIAFLWRCLDYPHVRDVASLLSFGDDLHAPFWPFIAFALGWFLAWILSFWRRGAESVGLPARYLLYMTVPSFLIGCALLIGNGDVAGAGSLAKIFGKDSISIGVEIWAPLVGLVLGGLFPFLRPRRLLQSGINPSKPWERAVFTFASLSLLVGMPLLIVGILARENISGYNDHPYRKVIRTDVESWPAMLAMILPHENEVPAEHKARVQVFRQSLARMPYDEAEPFQPTDEQIKHISKKLKLSNDSTSEDIARQYESLTADEKAKLPEKAGLLQNDMESIYKCVRKVRRKRAHDALQQTLRSPSERKTRSDESVKAIMEVQFAELLNGPLDKATPDNVKQIVTAYLAYIDAAQDPVLIDPTTVPETVVAENLQDEVVWLHAFLNDNSEQLARDYPWAFLYLRAYELARISKYAAKKRSDVMKDDEYSRWQYIWNYAVRVYNVGGWLICRQDNDVRKYWDAKERQKVLQDDICNVLDQHVFADAVLLDEQIQLEPGAAPVTDDVSKSGITRMFANFGGNKGAEPEDVESEAPVDTEKSRYDALRNSLTQRAMIAGPERLQQHEIHQLNRMLLEKNLPNVLRERTHVRRLVSIQEDQWARLKWILFALGIFLVAMYVDLNGVSLHHYYRDRIVQAFIKYKNEKKKQTIPLSHLKTTDYGSPYHLISGTVNVPRRKLGESPRHVFRIHETEADGNAEAAVAVQDSDGQSNAQSDTSRRNRRHRHVGEEDQRWSDSFLFSRRFCGSQITGYEETEKYEQSVRGEMNRIDLADSIAISGAAISPGHVRNWLIAFLMFLFNFRLGQWLPNPKQGAPKTRPRVYALLRDMFRKPENRSYCFVTDGGISDNLGLTQLLKRRCALIIAIDASYDPNHEFKDLGKAIRTARIHGGVRLVALEKDCDGHDVDLLPKPLQMPLDSAKEPSESAAERIVKKHFLIARICYADGGEGLLIYVKPSFDGDEGVDLLDYRAKNAAFPHESSADQFYDEAQVESYRQLGNHIGMYVCRKLPPIQTGEDLWDVDDAQVQQLCEWFIEAELAEGDSSSDPPSEHSSAVTPSVPR